MISGVLVGCVGALGVGYQAATLISRASWRRREARALRSILLSDIEEGRRSFRDPAVQEVLAWANTVVTSGRQIPLPLPPALH
jgi:hypothetical protein